MKKVQSLITKSMLHVTEGKVYSIEEEYEKSYEVVCDDGLRRLIPKKYVLVVKEPCKFCGVDCGETCRDLSGNDWWFVAIIGTAIPVAALLTYYFLR